MQGNFEYTLSPKPHPPNPIMNQFTSGSFLPFDIAYISHDNFIFKLLVFETFYFELILYLWKVAKMVYSLHSDSPKINTSYTHSTMISQEINIDSINY